MAGKGGARPGSGRPSLVDEQKVTALSMKCVELTLEYIQDPSVSLKDRADVFSRIAAKVVPQNVGISGELSHNVFIADIIQKSQVLND